jgi:hypothetical protein
MLNIKGNDALYVINNRDNWHFIAVTIRKEEDRYLRQRTIPKFMLAEAVQDLMRLNAVSRSPVDKT